MTQYKMIFKVGDKRYEVFSSFKDLTTLVVVIMSLHYKMGWEFAGVEEIS